MIRDYRYYINELKYFDSDISENVDFDNFDFVEDYKELSLDNIYKYLKSKSLDPKRIREPFVKRPKFERDVTFWYKDRKYIIFKNRKSGNINMMRGDKRKGHIIRSMDDILVKMDEIAQEKDDNILGYFVCHAYRQFIYGSYCKEFLKSWNPTIHKTYKDAYMEMMRGFYDDSDYAVVELKKDGNVRIIK